MSPDPEEEKRRRLWQLMAEQRNAPPKGTSTDGQAQMAGLGTGIGAGIRRLKPLFFGERSETGYIPEVSESIYHAVTPWAATSLDSGVASDLADAMSRIARGDPGAPREGDDLRPGDEEDAFRMYLGLPQEHGTFEESRFRPSVGSGEDIRYRDFVDQERVLNELVQEHSMILDPLYELDKPSTFSAPWAYRQEGQERPNAIRDVVRMLDDESSGVKSLKQYKSSRLGPRWEPLGYREGEGGPFHRYSDLLGTYTLDKGEDERGSYLSYYDKYDLAHLPARVSKAGKPFDVYGRMYYDPETYEYLDPDSIYSDRETMASSVSPSLLPESVAQWSAKKLAAQKKAAWAAKFP